MIDDVAFERNDQMIVCLILIVYQTLIACQILIVFLLLDHGSLCHGVVDVYQNRLCHDLPHE